MPPWTLKIWVPHSISFTLSIYPDQAQGSVLEVLLVLDLLESQSPGIDCHGDASCRQEVLPSPKKLDRRCPYLEALVIFAEKMTFELALGGCMRLVQRRQRVHQVVGTGCAKCGGVKGHEVRDRVTCPLDTPFWPMSMHQLLRFFELEEEERKTLVLRSEVYTCL